MKTTMPTPMATTTATTAPTIVIVFFADSVGDVIFSVSDIDDVVGIGDVVGIDDVVGIGGRVADVGFGDVLSGIMLINV